MAEEDLDTAREAMLDWITANWAELAAFAWRGFALDRRGIVVIQGDWQGEVIVAHQTPGIAEGIGLGWPAELHATVQQYEPATQIISVVQCGGSGILSACGRPRPVAATSSGPA